MDSIAEIITEEAAMEFPGMSNPSKLSDADVNRIAEALVEKAAEDIGIRDIVIGSAMGKGAIPLYGRETRKELCSCCLIDPGGPNAPENRMCTTKGAIGTLSNGEEREWCSEINIVADGRCARARSIREAARVCKEKYPKDTTRFFECYAPAFSKITRGNPSKEPWQMAKDEFINYMKTMPRTYREALLGGEGRELVLEATRTGKSSHQLLVEQALKEGKPVPYEVLADYPDLQKKSNPGEYITITYQGGTTFKVGEIISREAFERENERVKRLSKKPATGR